MLLRLEAIKFNHDSSSASVDAFNIRKNETEFVEVPEWRRGVSVNPEDSPAAYALCETRGNTLTIQARFSYEDRGVDDVDIRAIDGRLNPPGPSPMVVRLLRPLLRSSVGNVLGEVEARNIKFCGHDSGFQTFNLKNVQIWDSGIGVEDIVWRWQYKHSGTGWTDFANTTHRIYSVLRLPTQPWVQDPYDVSNTELPWVDVLDYSCNWAAGTQNSNDAAQFITSHVNELGFEVVTYDGSAYYTDQEFFNCNAFVTALRGGLGEGARVNCDDCAAIVSTFSNALGCDLFQLCINPSGALAYGLKPHLRIGIAGWLFQQEFLHHSVAAEGCGEADEVFDACLRVDGDDVPGTLTALLPTNLKFGHLGEHGYRFRLVIPEDESKCVLGNCRRRHLGPSKVVVSACADILSLKRHYSFESWAHTDAVGMRLFALEFFFANLILPDLKVIQLRESTTAQPPSIHSFWVPKEKAGEVVIRIDLYECISWVQAREVVMSLLTSFQEPGMDLQHDIALGDVAFANSGFISMLFATGNLVFFLRNVGRKNIPLTHIAKAINNVILNPPHLLSPASISDEVKRFHFQISEASLGQPIRIIETPADPLARRRFYQFFSEQGEISRLEGGLSYKPKAAGPNTVDIFGVDAAGNSVHQVLQLQVFQQDVPSDDDVFV